MSSFATTDPSLNLLLQHLQSAEDRQAPCLWLADEHHNGALQPLAPFADRVSLLSNRFDVAQQAQQLGLSRTFSDWRLAGQPTFARVYLRICKEKPVNLHLLRLSYNHLSGGGTLLLAGQKSEGIKTIAKLAETLFNGPCRIKKHGTAYLAELIREQDTDAACDLSEYHQLQSIEPWQGLTLQSKFGVYGWNKIDRGSELLMECVERYVQQQQPPSDSLLDIGCGYGFLSIASRTLPCTRRVATDNNAAALLCTAINAQNNALDIEVVVSDCADSIQERFDIVLCNPPFHKGFDTEGSLTQRFLQAAARTTNKHGTAFFVVNSFIALESKIKGTFRALEVLENNGQFKVIAFKH